MKKVVKFASLLLVGGSLIFTSCSKKKDDEVTPVTPPAPVCDGGSVKTISTSPLDNSSNANTYEKNYTLSVNKCDGSAIIFLDVKSDKDMDKIYMVLSQDNGPSSPIYAGDSKGFAGAVNASSTPEDKTFSGGSSSKGYSLDIPDGLASSKYIKVPVSVPVRNSDAATTDVYTIWITNGNGDFTANGKRTVIGPLTVTLNYKGASSTYISGTAILGDQNATPPSYLTTNGQIGTFSGTALIEASMTPDEKSTTLNSADINFVGLAADGATIGAGQTPYFIGVGLRTSVGFTGNTEGSDRTKFGVYAGSKSFDDMTASDISGLTAPTAEKIIVTDNTTYVFLTSDNRKGVIRTSSLSTAATGKTVNVKVKSLTR
ncbi:MAG: hypothetical protein H7329_04775 [Opitutaceae bacterium]|nr:hypothetical protein [Cytophagales bacterium]